PRWEKTLTFDGTALSVFDVPMPANGSIRGVVKPLPGASQPSILSILSPSAAELLTGPIVGTPGAAALPRLFCPQDGVYRMTAVATGGTAAFRVSLRRSVPALPRAHLDLRNG